MDKNNLNNDSSNNSDATILTDNIFGLIKSMNNLSSNQDLINKALEIFGQISFTRSSAFIKMNPDTFAFSLYAVFPNDSKSYFEAVFEKISNNGALGSVFQSGGHYLFEFPEYNRNNLILPVQSTKNIIGLFVLSADTDYSSMSIQTINLLMLLAKGIGLSYENAILIANKQSTEQLIEQLVASRTVELVENNQKLSEKIQALTSNISMSIPHEVRTPINEILGTAKYLQSFIKNDDKVGDSEKEDVLELLADITSSASRLSNLFENFIYHTRLSLISTSLSEIERLQSKICLYCDSVIYEQAMLRAIRYDRKDDMEINLVSANIKMGEEYLIKLIDEVVDNALKYSKQGNKVHISSTIQQELYCIKIKDIGSGMPTEYIDLLDSYMQYDRKTYEQQGLGLGLSIIFKIVDLHNGTMEIDSKINEYTTIYIKIPISKV